MNMLWGINRGNNGENRAEKLLCRGGSLIIQYDFCGDEHFVVYKVRRNVRSSVHIQQNKD